MFVREKCSQMNSSQIQNVKPKVQWGRRFMNPITFEPPTSQYTRIQMCKQKMFSF